MENLILTAVRTTVGYGDLLPVGHMRLISGAEALCGLILITWTASLGYSELKRFLENDEENTL